MPCRNPSGPDASAFGPGHALYHRRASRRGGAAPAHRDPVGFSRQQAVHGGRRGWPGWPRRRRACRPTSSCCWATMRAMSSAGAACRPPRSRPRSRRSARATVSSPSSANHDWRNDPRSAARRRASDDLAPRLCRSRRAGAQQRGDDTRGARRPVPACGTGVAARVQVAQPAPGARRRRSARRHARPRSVGLLASDGP